jgi:hypothetical protein
MESTDYNNALNYDLAVIQLAEDVGAPGGAMRGRGGDGGRG